MHWLCVTSGHVAAFDQDFVVTFLDIRVGQAGPTRDVFDFPRPPALRKLFAARAARPPALGLGDVPLGTVTGVIYMGGRQRFLPLPVKKTHSSILRRGAWGQPIPFTHTLQCGGFRHLHCVANSAVSQRSGGSAPATA